MFEKIQNYNHLFYRIFLPDSKLLFKFFYVCLPLKKLVNKKNFSVKEKFNLIFKKEFF